MNKSPPPLPPTNGGKMAAANNNKSPPVSPRNSSGLADKNDTTLKMVKKESHSSKGVSPRPESTDEKEKKEKKASRDSKSHHHHHGHHSGKDHSSTTSSPANLGGPVKSPSLRLPLPVPPATVTLVSSAPPLAASNAASSPTSSVKSPPLNATPPGSPNRVTWMQRSPSNTPLRRSGNGSPGGGTNPDLISQQQQQHNLTASNHLNNIGQTRFQRSSPRGGNPKVTCIGPYQFDRTAPLGRCTFLGVDTRYSPPPLAPNATSSENPQFLQVVVKVVEKRSPAAEYSKLEYQLLKCFDHPHVVRVIDSLEDDTCHYFVTEYLSGGRLIYELGTRGKLGPEELLRQKMSAIVSAVLYNHHMRAVIYRELLLDWIVYFKPENVYIGPQGIPKVGAFGYLDPKKHPRTWVRQWSCASFAAPEILTSKSYLMAVDTWSLGILLHLMATGAFPFHGTTAEEMIAAVHSQNQPFRNPSPTNPLSNDLISLLNALLVPHPYKRLPCAEILKHAWFNKAPFPVASLGNVKASNASANQPQPQPPPLGKSVKIVESTKPTTPNSQNPSSTEETAPACGRSTRSSIFGLFSSSRASSPSAGADVANNTSSSAATTKIRSATGLAGTQPNNATSSNSISPAVVADGKSK